MQFPGMSVEPRDERRGALARHTRQGACVHVAPRKTVNAQSPVAVCAAAKSLTVRVNPVQAHWSAADHEAVDCACIDERQRRSEVLCTDVLVRHDMAKQYVFMR
jgi:hypothetical protein